MQNVFNIFIVLKVFFILEQLKLYYEW